MKRLALILCLLWGGEAQAQWALRTAWAASDPTGSADTIVFTFATTTATDLLVCGFRWSGGGIIPSSVADSLTQTWSQAYYVDSSVDVAVYYKEGTAGGSSVAVTMTLSGASSGRTVACGAYSGIATSSALDKAIGQAQTNPGTGTDAVTSTATMAIAEANELVLGVIQGNEEGITYTAGTDFTDRLNVDNTTATNSHWLIEDRTLSAPSTATATATVSSTTVDTVAVVAAFKIATAAVARKCIVGGGLIC